MKFTVRKDGECKDWASEEFCNIIKENGLCEKDEDMAWKCAVTCGKCTDDGDGNDGGCKDEADEDFCKEVKEAGCKDEDDAKKCAKSCDKCGDDGGDDCKDRKGGCEG